MGFRRIWVTGVFCVGLVGLMGTGVASAASKVEVSDSRLVIDGVSQPYLFGAELQYFRARGGPGPNVPKAKVDADWEKLLTRATEAHINFVSLYVPWDFHEPQRGVFDFTGTLDRDGDGRPDYPSRNLRGFLERLVAHGFQRILIRPGPYINAEWGPEGFGAIPQWFFHDHPEAIAATRDPNRPKTVSFGSPVYRRYAKAWFRALYDQVLHDFVGPGKPVVMLQLDNETNFFWDSIYERDRNPVELQRYHAFLAKTYGGDIQRLDRAYHGELTDFAAVPPPRAADDRTLSDRWHYDWFAFHDAEIDDYYHFLRDTWRAIGVHEPAVLFTSCDSFNAPHDGLLPRLDFRDRDQLTLTTMNLYPKTSGTAASSTLNTPTKGAHDVELMEAAHRLFYRSAGDWLLATETMGGWFPDKAEVTLPAREHTYLSIAGSGLKAMVIYYFHEGWNWNAKETDDSVLRFDAPLDENLNPRPAFDLIRRVGIALTGELGATLMGSRPLPASVLIAHDTSTQYPLPGKPDAVEVSSTESAALFGFFRELGELPDVSYVDALAPQALSRYRLIVWNSPGYLSPQGRLHLQGYLDGGGTLLWIGPSPSPLSGKGLVQWSENYARDWNSDAYVHATDLAEKLARGRAVLMQAGLGARPIAVPEDGQPRLQSWERDLGPGHRLLAIENFASDARTVHLAKEFGGEVTPLFTASPGLRAGPDGRLPVSANGVDLWEVVSGPSPAP